MQDPLADVLAAIRQIPCDETPISRVSRGSPEEEVTFIRANRAALLDMARTCLEAAGGEPLENGHYRPARFDLEHRQLCDSGDVVIASIVLDPEMGEPSIPDSRRGSLAEYGCAAVCVLVGVLILSRIVAWGMLLWGMMDGL